MDRLDVFRLSKQDGGGLVVNVQADLLDFLTTRIVVPLSPMQGAIRPASELNPQFDIGGARYVFAAQGITAVSRNILRNGVASLAAERDAVTRALDVLLHGF
jgi:toxin CcdB